MKKIFAVTLALLLLCGCSKTCDDVSSAYVYKEVIPTSTVTENSDPIAVEDKLIKIKDNTICVENLEFNFKTTDENDSLFGVATKKYRTETSDSIVIDSEDHTIYKLYLSDKTVLSDNLKAVSTSETDLKLMATKIATALGADVKRYNVCNVKFDNTYEEYNVRYALTVKGFTTSEYLSITFDKDLNFCRYYCMPNIFDNIDVSNLVIDEKAIIDQINQESMAKRGESFGHNEIQSMILTVEDSKVIMRVDYIEYKKDGTRLVSNGIASSKIPIK